MTVSRPDLTLRAIRAGLTEDGKTVGLLFECDHDVPPLMLPVELLPGFLGQLLRALAGASLPEAPLPPTETPDRPVSKQPLRVRKVEPAIEAFGDSIVLTVHVQGGTQIELALSPDQAQRLGSLLPQIAAASQRQKASLKKQ